jgi:hypothetical protein
VHAAAFVAITTVVTSPIVCMWLWESYATEPMAAGIGGTQEFGYILRHDLKQTRWSGGEIVFKETKIIETIVNAFVKAYAIVRPVF